MRFSGSTTFSSVRIHWIIADLIGTGKHIRTVPVPTWAKAAIDQWTTSVGITADSIFRQVHRAGEILGDGLTPKAIWHVVKRGGPPCPWPFRSDLCQLRLLRIRISPH